jgi:hypothetical protein
MQQHHVVDALEVKLNPISALAALLALAAAGCGGSGGSTTIVTADHRSQVAQLLKDVFAGQNRVQSGNGRARIAAQKGQRPRAEPEEGDLKVGQVSKFADDLWGRIEAVSY